MKITVIIPLRLALPKVYDEVIRIDRILARAPAELYDFIIINQGTPAERRGELEALKCRHDDLQIIDEGDPEDPFSIGRARDLGVQLAETDVIMFHDIDFLCETETYRAIFEEAHLRGLFTNAYDFMTIPTIYLTEDGTEAYLAGPEVSMAVAADRIVHNAALRNDWSLVEHTAIGSSALVANRNLYLISGGHDKSFVGHGAEDFEFYNRLTDLVPRFQRPPQFDSKSTFFKGEWTGFRTYFALYGMDLWMRGVAMVHLHHPRRERVDKGYQRSQENMQLLSDRMRAFWKLKTHLPPLPDHRVQTRSLALVPLDSSLAVSLRQVFPLLGDCISLPETAFDNVDHLKRYVTEKLIDQILFLNPYGNEFRLDLFTELRAAGVRCIAFDRGALPDSWFFDDDGFLGTSKNYAPDAWDHPLTEEQRAAAATYCEDLATGSATLEANDDRLGAASARQTLGIQGRKIIFAPLQRPADTATRFFAGPCGSTDGFYEWLVQLNEAIDRTEHVIVAKRHPLEATALDLPGVVYAPPSMNVHDLIEAADKVVLINSGVGLLALADNRPVIVCGDAFYSHPGLAWDAKNPEELIALATSDLVVDEEKKLRFLHYLTKVFYSFGKSFYRKKTKDEETVTRIVNRIDFESIRQIEPEPRIFGRRPKELQDSSFVMRGVQRLKISRPAVSDMKVDKDQPRQKEVIAANANLILNDKVSLSQGVLQDVDSAIRIPRTFKGHAFYGPYLDLEPGSYEVRISISARGGPLSWMGLPQTTFVAEVCNDTGSEVLAIQRTKSGKREVHQTLSFDIPDNGDNSQSNQIEVRLWLDAQRDTVVRTVSLNRK